MSLLGIRGGVKKYHTATISLAGLSGTAGTPATNDYDITSLGISDYTKCKIITNMGSLDEPALFVELTSNVNLRVTTHTTNNNTQAKVQIEERY